MTERNKNNRIIFLTTLSVYLGLVLVGGAPPVLAQNLPGTFDETLKQNPALRRIVEECGQIKPRVYRKGYGEDIALSYSIDEFINALIDLSAHAVCLSSENFGYESSIIYPASPQFLVTNVERQKPTSKVTWTSGVLTSHITALGNTLPHTRKRGETYFQIDFEVNKTNLVSVAKFTQDSDEQARQTAEQFASSLMNWQAAERNAPESAIYENTKITFENNQVIIVTRLPRGSLDALLKRNAKAENE